MLLNIGQDKIISDREIIGIFDLDNTTVSKATRDYINFSVKKDECVTVSPDDLPKSFIVCEKTERELFIFHPLTRQRFTKDLTVKVFSKLLTN